MSALKIILFAGPRSAPSTVSPYALRNRIVEKNNITPAGSEIHGKRPHSAQMSRGSIVQWTGARNTTDQVMAAYLRGVLVAISIPIFTSQLRKAKVATDLANIRAAKAAAAAQYLTSDGTGTVSYNYDAAKGVVYLSTDAANKAESIDAYGKTSDPKATDGFDSTDTTTHVGKIVQITITGNTDSNNASTTYSWVAGKTK